jgi:hypothetical protein
MLVVFFEMENTLFLVARPKLKLLLSNVLGRIRAHPSTVKYGGSLEHNSKYLLLFCCSSSELIDFGVWLG